MAAEREGAMDVDDEEQEEEEEEAVIVDMTFAHLIPNIRILLPASNVKPPPFPPSLSLSLFGTAPFLTEWLSKTHKRRVGCDV